MHRGRSNWRSLLFVCLVSLLWFGFASLRAQVNADPLLIQAIQSARKRLQVEQPTLSTNELDRLAESLGRSNHLARAIVDAIVRFDLTNSSTMLERFPGKVDDLKYYDTPLLLMTVNGNKPEILDLLLRHGANPNARSSPPFVMSPLPRALELGYLPLASQLIEAGADVNATNYNGLTSLGIVTWPSRDPEVKQAREKILRQLLEHGAEPFVRSYPQAERTLVEESFDGQDQALADLLLTNRPSLARRTPEGQTALHLAALYGRTNALNFLLTTGFSVDQTNSDGLTPLQLVTSASELQWRTFIANALTSQGIRQVRILGNGAPVKSMLMSEMLLNHGATLDVLSAASLGLTNELAALLRTNPAALDTRDSFGRTPLHYAAFNSVELAAGGQSRRASASGLVLVPGSPTHAAIMLIHAGADNAAATTRRIHFTHGVDLPAGTTPLHLAVRRDATELTAELLRASALPSPQDENGDTPLHFAAQLWPTNCLSLLLKAHTPINATNHAGQTALRNAVESGSVGAVSMLLQAGGQTNVDAATGSLLHLAAERGRAEVISLLFERGFAVDARDAQGRTPFWLAVSGHHWDAANLLLAKGANVNAAATNGNTALHQLMTQHDDQASHLVALSYWQRWEQQSLAKPGPTRTLVQQLVNSKILPPPRLNPWTNTSLTVWLLDHGAKPDFTNNAGQTPLHLLCDQTQYPLFFRDISKRLNALLKAGARTDVFDTGGATPLHLVARRGTPEALAALLSHEGKTTTLCERMGRSPLESAMQNEQFAATNVSVLLARGANPNARDKDGLTPLQHALTNGSPSETAPKMVNLLLASHARPDVTDARGQTPLHWMAREGGPHAMTNCFALLTHGANPNARDQTGLTPLHLAVTNRSGHRVPLVQLLLAHHALPDMPDANGQTPLLWLAHAIQGGDYFEGATETLEILLQAGADATRRDTNGQTLLHFWDDQPNYHSANLDQIYRDLLTHHPKLLNVTNAAGETPLHVAARTANSQKAQRLIALGADVTQRDAHGESALFMAAKFANNSIANQLRPPGTGRSFWWSLVTRNHQEFDTWLKADPHLATITFNNGETPMSRASAGGLTNFLERLIDLGAPLDARAALLLGRTNELRELLRQQTNALTAELLFDAVRLKRFESLRDFAAGRTELHAISRRGHSLLRDAIEYDQPSVADWLRAQGVELTLIDAVKLTDTNYLESAWSTNRDLANTVRKLDGFTTLMYAAKTEQPESTHWLLAHGAQVQAQGTEGWTALHVAAIWGSPEVACVLLRAGAIVDARDGRGFTPLHHAARGDRVEVAKLLIEAGADLNLRATNRADDLVSMPAGATPLHWAAHCGRLEMVGLLLQRGADATATNAAGTTPLSLVRTNGYGPRYRYSPASFREPPDGDEVWNEIRSALEQATVSKKPATAGK